LISDKEYSNRLFNHLVKTTIQTWSNKKLKTFEIDEENLEVIKLLVLYFSKNSEFEKVEPNKDLFTGELSLNKGIYLCGNVGSGKTLILDLINKCIPLEDKFNIVPCENVTYETRMQGIQGLAKYTKYNKDGTDLPLDILFDDLGIDCKTKFYGDEINPMYDILMRRYRAFCYNGSRTHFTSNLSFNDLEQNYDTRFQSRIKEMCNIIKLGGKSTSKDRRN